MKNINRLIQYFAKGQDDDLKADILKTKLSDFSKAEFENCTNGLESKFILDLLNAYYSFELGENQSDHFHCIHQNGYDGIAINLYNSNIDFEQLREAQIRIVNYFLMCDYVVNHAEIKTSRIPHQLKTTYTYNLKPSLKFRTTKPFRQLYGAIGLEIALENDELVRFKVFRKYYSDRTYSEAIPFKSFLDQILSIYN